MGDQDTLAGSINRESSRVRFLTFLLYHKNLLFLFFRLLGINYQVLYNTGHEHDLVMCFSSVSLLDLNVFPKVGGCSGGRAVSTSASHQCSPGLIPGWGSDPGTVSEKGFVPV